METIIRLKNLNKPTTERATISEVAKSTIWFSLDKNEFTDQLSNAKRSKRQQKSTEVDDHRLFPLLRKTTLHQLVKNTPKEVSASSSVYNQETCSQTVIEQVANHWLHFRAGRSD